MTNKKLVLKHLVTNITILISCNMEMLDTIKKLSEENWQLQQQLNSLQNNLSPEDSRGAAQR